MEKELRDILECLMKYTSDGDKEQDDRYLDAIEMDLVAYFKRVFRKPVCSNNKYAVPDRKDMDYEKLRVIGKEKYCIKGISCNLCDFMDRDKGKINSCVQEYVRRQNE